MIHDRLCRLVWINRCKLKQIKFSADLLHSRTQGSSFQKKEILSSETCFTDCLIGCSHSRFGQCCRTSRARSNQDFAERSAVPFYNIQGKGDFLFFSALCYTFVSFVTEYLQKQTDQWRSWSYLLRLKTNIWNSKKKKYV